jgi:hypothetical protein
MPTSRARFSPARRSVLKRTGAAGLSWFIPACSPPEPAKTPPESTQDFAEGALRLDLRQWRRNGAEDFTLERLRFEQKWPGRRTKLADSLDWGDYRLSVYDPDREALLFRQGFDTNLDPAARSGTTQISVRFPVPRRPVRAEIEKRRREGAFRVVSGITIDPNADSVDRSAGAFATRVDAILASGGSGAKVDVAMLGDGYLEVEYPKFVNDATRAAGYLFSIEPFRKRKRDFNVYSVFAPSASSGVTDAYLGLKKDTVFRCAYYTGGSERSLADGNNHAVREVASSVPYDFLLILANARRYGGSSYFGGPAVVAIDSAAAKYLVVHELAHTIGGLADEYYIPAAHGPAFVGNVEPWHPNVAISAERAKWRDLLTEAAPRPTRWNKAEYEKYFANYVRRYNQLRESGAEEAVVEKFMDEERRRQAALLAKNGSERRVGLFEGANGSAKGAFRSEVDCIMFSLQTDYFCAACSAAIERMIDEHCG